MVRSKTKIVARLQFDSSGQGRMSTVFDELDMTMPPIPKLVEEKLAILRIADANARINSIGFRTAGNVFYLWFTPEEIKQLKESTHETIGEV